MRNSGNFQQQSLMLKTGSGSKRVAVCLLAIGMLTTVACTRMPVDRSAVMPVQVSDGKMQVVAQTMVGAVSSYVDTGSGASVRISVLSEYFSAGGRQCRRFAESGPIGEKNGLACQDNKNGWIEIPIQSITD